MKTCTKCGIEKPTDDFSRGVSYKDGYLTHCKKCVREYSKAHGIANRARRSEQARLRRWERYGRPKPKPDPFAASRVCSKCGTEKPIEEFPLTYRKAGGRRSDCQSCRLIQTNAWRDRNKEHVNKLARERSKSEKSRRQARERKKRWRENNPDKKKAQTASYTGPEGKLRY